MSLFDDDDDYEKNALDETPLFPPPPERSSRLEFTIIAVIALVCTVATPFVLRAFAPYFGIDDLQSIVQNLTPEVATEHGDGLRWLQIISQVCNYIIPSLLFAHLMYDLEAYEYLFADRVPRLLNAVLGLALLVVSTQFIAALQVWNKGIALPDWMRSAERTTDSLLQAWLVMPSIKWLLLNLVAMALLPAIAEEFWFRGILQRVLARFFRNPHVGIWVTAVWFSTLHFQFEGFLPRLFLGAMLGYLVYWSGSLWLSILVHASFNSTQLIFAYQHPELIKTMTENSAASSPLIWWQVAISVALTGWFVFFIHAINRTNREEYEQRLIENT